MQQSPPQTKPQLYVFEGADRVGKSTLSIKLANQLQIPRLHFSAPDKQLQVKLGKQYQYLNLVDDPQSCVLDRSWVSGLFYDEHRRQECPQTKSALMVDYCLQAHYQINYIFVYRAWTKSLRKEHEREIAAGEGYGTLKERYSEHISWPLHFLNWSNMVCSDANIWILHSDPERNILSELVEYHAKPYLRLDYEKVSTQLSRIAFSQSIYSLDSSF